VGPQTVVQTARPDGVRLTVRGRLEGEAVERLRALLEDAVVAGAVVQVDLSRAEDLPVAVLRALASAHRRLAAGPGGVVVERPSPPAVRALRTSGLDRVLPVRPAPAPAERPALAAQA
jgi:anti-sigma B factor antagonist